MAGKLDGLQAVATKLIEDFGGPATLRAVTQTYSAVTGKTTPTNVDTAVLATPPEPYAVGRIDGSAIRNTDLSTLVKGDGLSPQVGDRMIKGGVNYQIVAVRPQSAGTVIAFYEIQLRA